MKLSDAEFKKLTQILKKADNFDRAGKFALANELFDENPWVLDYDERGNWVGPVANENGITA